MIKILNKIPFKAFIASIIGCCISLVWNHIYIFYFLLITTLLASFFLEKRFKLHDPKFFVLDELTAAYLIPFLVNRNIYSLVFAIFLFRLIDNLKPFPINLLDKIRGPIGTVIDDLSIVLFIGLIL